MAREFDNDHLGAPWHMGSKEKSCYHTHPPLKLVRGPKEYFLYGGSCSTPVVKDADIYIGFDRHSMHFHHSAYPWDQSEPKVIEFLFAITDMSAPHDVQDFKNMITWVCNQLQEGKKIHAGCIGGHGRTGTFLAAVTAQFTGNLDAISYVRKHYCDRVVESETQVRFLAKHFGIVEVQGYKEGRNLSFIGDYSYKRQGGGQKIPPFYEGSNKASPGDPLRFATSKRTIAPVASSRCIW